MVSKCVLGALAVYSAVAAAAPTAASQQSFSLKQVAVPKTTFRAPAHAYAKALAKYGAEVPGHVAAAAASTGSVPTQSEGGDEEYITQVTVGGTTLGLDIDTGSADLWVFSSETPASERTGHSYYTPGSTAKKLSGYTWDISYGDGSSASGDVYTDTVTVGGVTYAKQAVESAKKVSSEFTDDTYSDGLLGLAFSSINTVSPTAQKTFFANVASSLASPLFAADLKHNAAGVYDFGWTDSSKYTGSITYTDVDSSEGFWQFTSTSYAINGKNANKALNGIADTGTTLLLIAETIVSKYYAQVSGAKNSNTYGGWVFPCTATLPSFSLIIGSYSATVPGDYINYGAAEDTGTTCYGGIQSDAGIGFSIFGDIFLKSQYVVFDNSGPQIGFAAQAS